MKIVFVIFSLDSGGMENYLLRFLNSYYQEFECITIWCKNGKGGVLESEYQKIPNLNIITQKIPLLHPRALGLLNRNLKGENINAICDFTGNYAGLMMWMAKRAGINKRIVFYRRSSNAFGRSILKKIYNNLFKCLNRKYATDILANSKTGLTYFFRGKYSKDAKYRVVYNDVEAHPFMNVSGDLRQKLNIPKNAFVIGHTGRYNEAKNHEAIISVAAALVAKYEDVYFLLCGQGVRSNLEEEVIKKNIANKVFLFENRNDIPLFLNSLDCYYFPSITEGQPNALIEAMMIGLPFVASNIGSIQETIPENYHSQLLDPMDVDSAISKIEYIKNDKDSKKHFLESRKATIERFGQNTNFDLFLRIIFYNYL